MSAMTDKSHATGRILSLDQYRGYTIFGMFLVNFLERFGAIPEFFKHHSEYITYADTIAPIFLFVAGVGFRLSFLRNRAKLGLRKALWIGLRRYMILTLIGIAYYDPINWRGWWDALVDIGLAGILALPFMGMSTAWRVGAACFYMLLYQALFMFTPYGVSACSSERSSTTLLPRGTRREFCAAVLSGAWACAWPAGRCIWACAPCGRTTRASGASPSIP
jgi:predicted acyltransferase